MLCFPFSVCCVASSIHWRLNYLILRTAVLPLECGGEKVDTSGYESCQLVVGTSVSKVGIEAWMGPDTRYGAAAVPLHTTSAL